MIGSTIWREFSRQISEYRKFKFNLFFANLGFFFTVSGFLTYFDTNQSTFRNFILLVTLLSSLFLKTLHISIFFYLTRKLLKNTRKLLVNLSLKNSLYFNYFLLLLESY